MTAVMEPLAETAGANNGKASVHEFRAIPLEDLHESPLNRRTHYDPVLLRQLADNLKVVGQITPVIVRPRPRGTGYELAAGHRRFRAAELAGLAELNAVVRDLDEATFVEILNIENLQRDDLNALEEAQGFVDLIRVAGYDVAKISDRVGRSVKYVYDRIKLLQLIPEAKKLVLDKTLSPGHGILLARLSKDDQRRALEAEGNGYRGGGALESENIDESHFLGEPELELHDPKKARSVRELHQWIDDNVRLVPEKVDQADLAFDLPTTVELLKEAEGHKLKVVKITRDYRVSDAARDEKERTYGSPSWKRADGEPELYHHFGRGKPAPSKTCDYSRVGLVVAGPGRGEAFMVCVNKDKCTVHWAVEMKERDQRAKARVRGTDGAKGAPKERVDSWEVEQERKRKRVAGLQPARTALIDAVLAKVGDEVPLAVLRLLARGLFGNIPADLLVRGAIGKAAAIATMDEGKLARVIVAGLIGRDATLQVWNVDAKPQDLLEMCRVYKVDAEAVTAGVAAAEKAKAAKAKAAPAQTSAKPKAAAKKRAGDVARAKKKKTR